MRKASRFIRDVFFVFTDRNVLQSAAALTYFIVLSFFPILICINVWIGQLNLDMHAILNAAATVIPKDSLALLEDYIDYIAANRSTGLWVAGLIATLIPASAAVRTLMRTMEEIYRQQRSNGLHRLGFSILFSVILLVTIYVSLGLILTGGWFFRALERLLHIQIFIGSWPSTRFVLLLGVLFLFILLIYRSTLPKVHAHVPILPGAIFSAIILVGASILFSWFISEFTRYSLVYGSLASVIILLIWIYLCGNIILLGNVINYVYYYHSSQDGSAPYDP